VRLDVAGQEDVWSLHSSGSKAQTLWQVHGEEFTWELASETTGVDSVEVNNAQVMFCRVCWV
jgi:hypothetical protein